jgi:hypothetical protein
METLEQELSQSLREFARRGVAPSFMLREVIRQVGEDRADRQFLVRLVSAAFQFREGEGYVIFGWLPDGSGHLSDTQLDYQLSKRIQTARSQWDITRDGDVHKLVS